MKNKYVLNNVSISQYVHVYLARVKRYKITRKTMKKKYLTNDFIKNLANNV